MIELRSEGVPAPDRFAWWRSVAAETFGPSEITSPLVGDFPVAVRVIPLGPVHMSVLTLPARRSVRTWQTIRRSDSELWQIGLITRGAMGMEQHRSQALLSVGELVTYETSHPFDSWVGDDWPAETVLVHLPKDLLPIQDRRLRALAARSWPSGSGLGAVLGRFLEQVATQAGTWGPGEAEKLGSALLDLSAAFLAGLARTEGLLAPETRQTALLHQVRAFIEANLADGSLTPAAIAVAHNISVRYLHRLFEPEDGTVSAYVRTRRLERCREELAYPGLAVAAVGARWGFPDPAAFSRAFKARYGLPPGEYRRQQTG